MDAKKTIAFVLCLVSLLSLNVAHVENFEEILGKSNRTESFANFARKYGKTYAKPEELKQRFNIFSKNVDIIESTNRKKLSYTLGVNQFSDWSWEELKLKMLQTVPQNCSAARKSGHMLRADVLPESIDWRKKGIVSPVKEQSNCGSCWAFSTTGTLEAAYHKKFGKGISLSEQQLIDCAGAFNNQGCMSGLPSQGFQYIKYNGGLESEKAYPYQHIDGECKFSKDEVVVRVKETINITTGSEDELKHAVATVGPVSVTFDVEPEFGQYMEGIFRTNKCRKSPTDINHAMVAVGYGKENGIPYWIVKNSWGADWGEDGYIRIEMGKNTCGIAACASYPILA